ncbi:MAG: hypothetical protein R2712_08710 [Vicinamibacterales bacterium]
MAPRLGQPPFVVRDDADGGAVGVQLGEHLHERVAAPGVQVAGGLVGQQDGGPAGDGPRDGDELLVAAGQDAGPLPCAGREPDAFERSRGPGLALVGRDAPQRQRGTRRSPARSCPRGD